MLIFAIKLKTINYQLDFLNYILHVLKKKCCGPADRKGN